MLGGRRMWEAGQYKWTKSPLTRKNRCLKWIEMHLHTSTKAKPETVQNWFHWVTGVGQEAVFFLFIYKVFCTHWLFILFTTMCYFFPLKIQRLLRLGCLKRSSQSHWARPVGRGPHSEPSLVPPQNPQQAHTETASAGHVRSGPGFARRALHPVLSPLSQDPWGKNSLGFWTKMTIQVIYWVNQENHYTPWNSTWLAL